MIGICLIPKGADKYCSFELLFIIFVRVRYLSLFDLKEDVKNIFDEYNLIPSDKTNSIEFPNYYRKQNFTDRISFNGNSSQIKELTIHQEEAFKNAEERYNFGAMTQFDFDQVRTRLVNAEAALIRSKYNYVFKTKVLQFYSGELILE